MKIFPPKIKSYSSTINESAVTNNLKTIGGSKNKKHERGGGPREKLEDIL